MAEWDRQEGETDAAWKAFNRYLQLGDERSIAKAIEGDGKRAAKRRYESWSSTYRWVERARAWDASIVERIRKDREKDLIAMRKRHIEAGQAMQSLAASSMFKAVEAATEIPLEDVPRWMWTGVRIERLAAGEPTESVRQEVSGNINVNGSEARRRILADPEATRLAVELTRRLASEQPDPGSVRDPREPGEMEARPAPGPAEH